MVFVMVVSVCGIVVRNLSVVAVVVFIQSFKLPQVTIPQTLGAYSFACTHYAAVLQSLLLGLNLKRHPILQQDLG